MQPSFLFLFEPSSIQSFLNGKQNPVYSHDLNLLQLAQGAILSNCEVYFASYDKPDSIFKADDYWPKLKNIQKANSSNEAREFTFKISANHLAFLSSYRGNTKNILVQAAIHLVESPKNYYPAGIASYINVIRNAIDFVITQNNRMKDILSIFFMLMAGFSEPERILTSKLSPVLSRESISDSRKLELRKNMGITPDDIVLVNAGGAWQWTQFNELLLALNKCMSLNKDCKIHVIQPALTQSNNSDHVKYHRETQKILNSLPKDIRSRIHIGQDWEEGNAKLHEYLSIANYGLNLNLDSLEQWQSYRVRTLEYLAYGLPVIMSKGSFWEAEENQEAFIFVDHSVDGISTTLEQLIYEDFETYSHRVAAIKKIAEGLTIENQAQKTIKSLLDHEYLQSPVKFYPGVIWDFAGIGPGSKIGFRRFSKFVYVYVTQNRFTHRILVLIGVRKIYRFIKKLI